MNKAIRVETNMKAKPLHDHVIVKPLSEDEVTKSGIVLPDTVDKERPEKGEVVSIGPGKLLDNGQRLPISVKVGDRVMFKKYSPDEIKIDDEEYLVISEGDIMLILE
jgi:chaperonin GroES